VDNPPRRPGPYYLILPQQFCSFCRFPPPPWPPSYTPTIPFSLHLVLSFSPGSHLPFPSSFPWSFPPIAFLCLRFVHGFPLSSIFSTPSQVELSLSKSLSAYFPFFSFLPPPRFLAAPFFLPLLPVVQQKLNLALCTPGLDNFPFFSPFLPKQLWLAPLFSSVQRNPTPRKEISFPLGPFFPTSFHLPFSLHGFFFFLPHSPWPCPTLFFGLGFAPPPSCGSGPSLFSPRLPVLFCVFRSHKTYQRDHMTGLSDSDVFGFSGTFWYLFAPKGTFCSLLPDHLFMWSVCRSSPSPNQKLIFLCLWLFIWMSWFLCFFCY